MQNSYIKISRLTLLSVRTAANLRTGLDELKNNCRTVIAGVSSRLVTPFSSVIALAASSMTISALFLRQDSRKSKKGRSPPWFTPDSLITCGWRIFQISIIYLYKSCRIRRHTWLVYRISRHCAKGERTDPLVKLVTSLLTANRSFCLI